jgi:hypothetical protein
VYSPERVKQMTWLAGLLPYAQAVQVFERIAHVRIPVTSLWERTQEVGEALRTRQEAQQAQVSPDRVVLPPAGQDHTRPTGLSMDGGTLNIRNEGWKEFKVGTVYDIIPTTARDPQTHEEVVVARGEHIAYRAILGDVKAFAPAFWALAVQRGVPQAADVVTTADGAEWIWNVTDDLFPQSAQIVDWYHATQHVALAAAALYPNDEKAAQRWQQERREALYLGQIDRIIAPLEAAGLASEAHYFQTHQRRMQYQEFREEGYPIGSGTVESGIKQFKQRLTGAGMRWSRPGADRMLVIRAAVMTKTFDAVCAAALN